MSLTPEQENEVNQALAGKTGVLVAIPNMGARINIGLSHWLQHLAYQTVDSNCPWFFKIYMPNDLYPHENARNDCVREFLKEPTADDPLVYKRLWFIDADMIPPGNALDLLTFDEPMVSGMTYIWSAESIDKEGFYKPPLMKINGFRYRPEPYNDFVSMIPQNDGKAFFCDAAGAACLVIKREVLESTPEPWFRTVRDPYGRCVRSEDLDFCKRAMERGIRVMYVPKVTFGHLKEIDLRQAVRYGQVAMRDIIEKVKGGDPVEVAKQLPEIKFYGERPRQKTPEPAADVPMKLEVVQGGRG